MSIDKLDEAVKRVMGEILCPYPRPSHEHDELDCRVCALERRVRAALDEAVATAFPRCQRCGGAGERAYADSTTWRGGIGGQTITASVCDGCWGTGRTDVTGPNLRRLEVAFNKRVAEAVAEEREGRRVELEQNTIGWRAAVQVQLDAKEKAEVERDELRKRLEVESVDLDMVEELRTLRAEVERLRSLYDTLWNSDALADVRAANTRTERAEAAMRKAYGAALAIQAHGCTPQRLDLLFAAIEELRP